MNLPVAITKWSDNVKKAAVIWIRRTNKISSKMPLHNTWTGYRDSENSSKLLKYHTHCRGREFIYEHIHGLDINNINNLLPHDFQLKTIQPINTKQPKNAKQPSIAQYHFKPNNHSEPNNQSMPNNWWKWNNQTVSLSMYGLLEVTLSNTDYLVSQ